MLKIRETFVDQAKDCVFGETDWYQPWTDDRGQLFRALQREYGRCTGKVYAERADGDAPVGWVFERRDQYADTGRHGRPAKYYIREVWISVREEADSEG
jgi:hypothetical protein